MGFRISILKMMEMAESRKMKVRRGLGPI